jgi:FkbM family methyltransferase
VHYLRRHAKRVIAFEPMPALARTLRRKFRRGVVVESVALSDGTGTVSLHMPVVNGVVVTGCSTVSSTASATYPGHRAIDVPMDRLDSVYGGDVGFIKIDVEGHEQAVLDGAVETIRRCRPRLLVEIDERLSPGGLARAKAYFRDLGYRGYYVRAGRLEPIDRFSTEDMQKPANLPDLTAPLQQRERFGRYIYNFIFLPPGEPTETLRRLADRLTQL